MSRNLALEREAESLRLKTDLVRKQWLEQQLLAEAKKAKKASTPRKRKKKNAEEEDGDAQFNQPDQPPSDEDDVNFEVDAEMNTNQEENEKNEVVGEDSALDLLQQFRERHKRKRDSEDEQEDLPEGEERQEPDETKEIKKR